MACLGIPGGVGIGVRDQLRLGGGGAAVFCPNNISDVPGPWKTCWVGGGGGGTCAPFFFYRAKKKFPYHDFIRVIHVASAWKAKQKVTRKWSSLPEYQVVLPEYGYLKYPRGLQPSPPPPPRTPMGAGRQYDDKQQKRVFISHFVWWSFGGQEPPAPPPPPALWTQVSKMSQFALNKRIVK